MPLTAAIWSAAVFHRPVDRADLLFAILEDPRAAFICRALSGVDDETLEFVGDHPLMLTALHERGASAFGAFGGSLRIHDGRVIPPGGDAASRGWEAIVGESLARPERFIPALAVHLEGRTAYLYATISSLSPSQAAFAVSAWQDDAARVESMKALALTWSAVLREWRFDLQPFGRQANDAASLLLRLRAHGDGMLANPGARAFWTRVFESGDLSGDASKTAPADDRPIDAAWLVTNFAGGEGRRRSDRLDQLAFAQRVFGSAPPADLPDALVALRGMPRYRMLLLTLERMGVSKTAIYAAVVRHVSRLSQSDVTRGFESIAQFQGVVALLQRMTAVGTLDRPRAEALLLDLAAVPTNENGDYGGAVVRWIDVKLRAALPQAETLEQAIIGAIAGPLAGDSAPRIVWEGHAYRFDPGDAERRRLARVREKQATPSIDTVIAFLQTAHALSAPSLTSAQTVPLAMRLRDVADGFPQRGAFSDAEGVPAGVRSLRDIRAAIVRTADDLERGGAARNARPAARSGAALLAMADNLCAQTLISIVYALDLGDPEGSAFLGSDVSRRHDFGLSSLDTETRRREPWMLPRQSVGPGSPWRVVGSLLGLDVALATLNLQRISVNRVLEAPTLNTNERENFAVNVTLMDPRVFSDQLREELIGAIDRGRRRVADAGSDAAALQSIADTLVMDGWRRRALLWSAAHEPARLESMFSLHELAVLGDPDRHGNVRALGTAGILTSGCVCTEEPGPWQLFTGRPQVGMMAAAVVDLHLHVARLLRTLGLPARLEKYVLGAAMQDFVDEVRPTDADDWLTLARGGSLASRERIEDYVAAAAATGPLVPDAR
jgi:hypothetical protein